jgi:hypothetical protein
MNCARCGTALAHPGQGHSCAGGPVPATRPPAAWQAALWTALAFAVVYSLLCLVRAAITVGLIASPATPLVTVLAVAAPLALFAVLVVWAKITRGVVERLGGTVVVVSNWAISCFLLVFVASYLVASSTSPALHLARAAAAVLLVVGLLIARAKISRWLVEPAPAGVPAQPGTQPASVADPAGPAGFQPGQLPQQRRVGPRFGTPVARLPPPPEPEPHDWDAALWDPEVQRAIKRRRRAAPPA